MLYLICPVVQLFIQIYLKGEGMALKAGPLPKHYQLTEILRDQILSGEFEANDRFPTEETLCQQYRVSRGTVRRAISTLAQERLLRREQGRGTFVTRAYPQSTFFTLTGFAEDMRQQHRQPSTRLLSAGVIPAPPAVAERLAVAVGEPTLRIVRLRLADDRPVVHETRHLAQELCPHLTTEDLENQSIHWLLTQKYHLPLIRTTHTMEARILSSEEARFLETEPGTAAFFVDRLTYTVHGDSGERPAVWYQALYRGDEYHFKAEFQTAFEDNI